MRFEIYQDRIGEWRWRLVARNGRVTADSGEGYSSESNVRRAIGKVRMAAPFARVVKGTR